MDIPEASASLSPYVPLASEHVSLPHVPLHNTDSNSKNRAESAASFLLDYSED